jgi:predicted transcriptional regulator
MHEHFRRSAEINKGNKRVISDYEFNLDISEIIDNNELTINQKIKEIKKYIKTIKT